MTSTSLRTLTCAIIAYLGKVVLMASTNISQQTSLAGQTVSPVYSSSFLTLHVYFSHKFSSGNILKPLLDLTLFTSQLSRTLGARGTVALFLNYYITARILRAVTPAFGRLAAVEARLEGEYRAGVGRVGREAEEIAYVQSHLRCTLRRAHLVSGFTMAGNASEKSSGERTCA